MSNDTIDQIVEASLRTAERHAREGNYVSELFYRNEAWKIQHPEGWINYLKLETWEDL
jgi:hypothetical protein